MKSVVRSVVRSPVRSVVRADSAGSAASTLLDGLISWWSLDETSGTRADSHGSNDLTDNNTVTSTTGKVSNAARFVDTNNEYLTSASSVTVPAIFSAVAWVRLRTGQTDDDWPCSMGNSNRKALIFQFSSGELLHYDGANLVSAGAVSAETWYMAAFGYDGSVGWISLNGGARTTNALMTSVSTTDTVTFGSGNSVGGDYHGDIDEAAVWNRDLTADEISELYNSGNGIGYPG